MSRKNMFCRIGEDASFVRRSLTSFLEARVAAMQIRAEESATWTVVERVAFAGVLERIDAWIFDARAWLADRGLTCNEPGSTSADGASMAHGCAASSALRPNPPIRQG